MIKVIGVRFRQAGKVYFFDPMNMKIEKGQHVIVETARGVEYGNVVLGIREVEDDKVVLPLKPVIRIATAEDDKKEEANRKKEKEAYKICLEKIAKHKLEMKLIDVEYTFDNNKVLFYFTADGRVDFRELVKDLAGMFRTRIELRQLGVRDEAKMMTPEEVARIVARGIQKRKRLCLMENEGRATHFVKKFWPSLLDRLFYWYMSKEPDSPFK